VGVKLHSVPSWYDRCILKRFHVNWIHISWAWIVHNKWSKVMKKLQRECVKLINQSCWLETGTSLKTVINWFRVSRTRVYWGLSVNLAGHIHIARYEKIFQVLSVCRIWPEKFNSWFSQCVLNWHIWIPPADITSLVILCLVLQVRLTNSFLNCSVYHLISVYCY
jgi:hypothetical protein